MVKDPSSAVSVYRTRDERNALAAANDRALNGAVYSAALALTPQHVVERKDGKTGSRRALRARAGSRRGRRGRPVLQEPVLGAADSERRNCPGVRGVLSEVPEASMSAAAAMRAFNASGKVQACYRRPPDLSGSTLHAPFRVTTHRGHTVQTFQSLELALETAQSLDPDHYVID